MEKSNSFQDKQKHGSIIFIVTTLLIEYDSMKTMLDESIGEEEFGLDNCKYIKGYINEVDKNFVHQIVIAYLPVSGKKIIGSAITNIFQRFGKGDYIFLVGIAHSTNTEDGDRLVLANDFIVLTNQNVGEKNNWILTEEKINKKPSLALIKSTDRLSDEKRTLRDYYEAILIDRKISDQTKSKKIFFGTVAAIRGVLPNNIQIQDIYSKFEAKCLEREGNTSARAISKTDSEYLIIRGCISKENYFSNSINHYEPAICAAAFAKAIIMFIQGTENMLYNDVADNSQSHDTKEKMNKLSMIQPLIIAQINVLILHLSDNIHHWENKLNTPPVFDLDFNSNKELVDAVKDLTKQLSELKIALEKNNSDVETYLRNSDNAAKYLITRIKDTVTTKAIDVGANRLVDASYSFILSYLDIFLKSINII
ncbi:MAG: hypothetical protein ORO03_01675 [Alphaproteobacteria bacterium]|nr:hypothetical protein [Alphaproteobacteria bacterium]